MSLPLLKVIRQGEGQWIPGWRKVDRDVSFYASLADKLQHTNLREHVDPAQSIDKPLVLQSWFVVDQFSAAFPNEDRGNLATRLHHLQTSVIQLFHSRYWHPHVVSHLGQIVVTTYLRIHCAGPVEVAECRLQEVHNSLWILGRDVILTLQLRFHEATAVHVASKIRLCPAKQSFWRHVAWESRIFLYSSSCPRMAVNQLLCTCRQPS
mmetsp:Transcript_55063/g.98215  ORF Transcript_55063/g.98215 Transcript_55063/m.98215 type:complete len:208 (-) Transcript_55063:181-804(-)